MNSFKTLVDFGNNQRFWYFIGDDNLPQEQRLERMNKLRNNRLKYNRTNEEPNELLMNVFTFLDRNFLVHIVSLTCHEFYKLVHSMEGSYQCWTNVWNLSFRKMDSRHNRLMVRRSILSSNTTHYNSKIKELHVRCDCFDPETDTFDRGTFKTLIMFLKSNRNNLQHIELESHNQLSHHEMIHEDSAYALERILSENENGAGILQWIQHLTITSPLNKPFLSVLLRIIELESKRIFNMHIGFNSGIGRIKWRLKSLHLNIGATTNHSLSVRDVLVQCKHLLSCPAQKESVMPQLESFKCTLPFENVDDIILFSNILYGACSEQNVEQSFSKLRFNPNVQHGQVEEI